MNKYKTAEEIIAKKFDKSDENYALYYLCCYGLLDKFGHRYLSLIEELFTTCEFYIGNKPLEQLMEEANCSSETITHDMIASCSNGIIVNLDKTINKLQITKQKPKIFYSKTNDNANIDLISITHESTHILKGLKNYLSFLPDTSGVFIRNGFFVEFKQTDGNDIFTRQFHSIFDEMINVFQTADMMSAVKNIDRSKLDSSVLPFFDKLDLKYLDEPYGYNAFTDIINPLWDNKRFKNIIEENIIEGNLKDIKDALGNSFIEDISSTLDFIATTDISKKEIDEEFRRVKKMIYSYNKQNN